jgi:hypothetical protein
MTDISLQKTAKTARRGRGRLFGATVREGRRAAACKRSLFLAPVFPMELTDDIENGALVVDGDGAGSPDALAHGPRPAGRQFAEPGTAGIVPVQPQNRGAGGPFVTGFE